MYASSPRDPAQNSVGETERMKSASDAIAEPRGSVVARRDVMSYALSIIGRAQRYPPSEMAAAGMRDTARSHP